VSRPRLSVVSPGREASPAAARAWWVPTAAVLASALAAAVGVGVGADTAGGDPEERLRAVLEDRPVPDPDDPEIREIARSMRVALASNPLDARTRVLYGALLGTVSIGPEGRAAAAFHVQAAARLAPVTVPIVRRAVLLEVELDQVDRATERIRDMFDYDPEAAARLLLRVEPILGPERVARALGERPSASVAWADTLGRAGRADDAEAVLRRSIEIWPDDPPLLESVGTADLRAGRRDALVARFAGRDIAEVPGNARLLMLRGRARAWNGDVDGAAADLSAAERLSAADPAATFAVGDAWRAIGRPDDARRAWIRSRYRVGPRSELRVAVLRRLAALADDTGTAAESVRAWRRVLDEAPDDPVARRRIRELTGSGDEPARGS